jgi:hypothetical protein
MKRLAAAHVKIVILLIWICHHLRTLLPTPCLLSVTHVDVNDPDARPTLVWTLGIWSFIWAIATGTPPDPCAPLNKHNEGWFVCNVMDKYYIDRTVLLNGPMDIHGMRKILDQASHTIMYTSCAPLTMFINNLVVPNGLGSVMSFDVFATIAKKYTGSSWTMNLPIMVMHVDGSTKYITKLEDTFSFWAFRSEESSTT